MAKKEEAEKLEHHEEGHVGDTPVKFSLEDVQKLGKGMVISAADAALVHLGDNIASVNFGTWTPLVVTIVTVMVREARNLLHGGKVSDGTKVEAVEVKK